jgi:hypothetical protein
MELTIPRFEFRAFAPDFGESEQLIFQLGGDPYIRESSEIYIISGNTNINNTKIRNDLLDIKALIRIEQGLEQWTPVLKAEFPISRDKIINELLPAFCVDLPELSKETYSITEFIDEIVIPHHELWAVDVKKKRFGYIINSCMCEIAEVYIQEQFVKTVAVESALLEDIIKTKEMLKLDAYKNTNYLVAIKNRI